MTKTARTLVDEFLEEFAAECEAEGISIATAGAAAMGNSRAAERMRGHADHIDGAMASLRKWMDLRRAGRPGRE
ncbi:UNVERIFIED_CONTAM: hypothetical protein BEN50_25735 [Euhalothece sp. KZN 001]